MTGKYDIFLFDADNTLYDYDKAEAHALQTMFEQCGFTYSEDVRLLYREINEQAWRDYESGNLSKEALQIVRFERFFDQIGVKYDPNDFNSRYLAELGKGTFLVDGALEICRAITEIGKRIYIITNVVLATQQSRIKHSLIKDYISDFFVSEYVGYQKPDIRYFEHVLQRIPQIAKEQILIVGDSLSADIAGGRNVGIDTCWFNPSGLANDTKIKPTYEIRGLREVDGYI